VNSTSVYEIHMHKHHFNYTSPQVMDIEMIPQNLVWSCLNDLKNNQFLKGHNSVDSCLILKKF